jgi:hypothetical protein
MKLSLSILSPEVAIKRLKGYKSILAGQVSIITIFLFVFELFQRYPFMHWESVLIGAIGIIMIVMNLLTYWLIKELTNSKAVQYTIVTLIWLSVLLSISIGTEKISPQNSYFTSILAFSLGCSIVSFSIVLYYMIIDIFKEKHEISYRLWGSACIYLLFGAVFGLLYGFLEVLIPNEFMVDTPIDAFHIIPCYNLSFYTLSGIDSPFENFSMLVKNLTVIEAIFSNLFIVLVVGRLLAR